MIVFTTVNYNNTIETRKFIESYIALDESQESLLLIVDNSEDKAECKELEQCYINEGNIKFIYSNTNLGYMPGGASAYNYVLSKGIEFDYFILSNNDIQFDSNDIIPTLERYQTSEPHTSLISPRLISSGSSINPYLYSRPTKYKMMLWTFILSNYYFAKLFFSIISFKKKKENVKPSNSKIYATHGSIFIFTRKFFLLGGRLDEIPFLYGEEIYVAEQIRCVGGNCDFVDSINVSHVGSATLGAEHNRFKHKCLNQAHKFLCRRYFK